MIDAEKCSYDFKNCAKNDNKKEKVDAAFVESSFKIFEDVIAI